MMEKVDGLCVEELLEKYRKEKNTEYLYVLIMMHGGYIHFNVNRALQAQGILRDRAESLEADILQDISQKVIERIGEIKAKDEFGKWISNLAFNTARKIARKIIKEDKRTVSPDNDKVLRIPDPRTPIIDLIGDEYTQALNEFMGMQKENHALILDYYQDGYTAEEIASKLGTTKGSIEVTLHRKRKKLAEFLRQKGL